MFKNILCKYMMFRFTSWSAGSSSRNIFPLLRENTWPASSTCHPHRLERGKTFFFWLAQTHTGKRENQEPRKCLQCIFQFSISHTPPKKPSRILWFLYPCLHRNTSELESSVSLIFPSAERICKRAKVDFLRRRFLILVTFRSQTAYHSTFQQNTTFCSQTYNTT